MSEDKEAKLTEMCEQLSKDIEAILLKELSEQRVEWVMPDITHLIFSHALTDIIRVCDE